MKSIVITFFLTVQCLISFGQTRVLTDADYNNSGAIKLTFVSELTEAKNLARQDIDKGTPFLLLQSGIAPVVYTTDSIFENKFRVYYYEQGCSGSDNELMKAYNIEIFKYLDEQFGKKWRKSIRKDVIGIEKWKRKK
ncbi:MAG: hypothetical protein ACTJGA_09950 [Mesonia hippocampi]|uniref:FEKKY domain-containing protein n=1 Tax=Mesonia hippocampi TaxID=1628250 RepID=UPI003F9E336A